MGSRAKPLVGISARLEVAPELSQSEDLSCCQTVPTRTLATRGGASRVGAQVDAQMKSLGRR